MSEFYDYLIGGKILNEAMPSGGGVQHIQVSAGDDLFDIIDKAAMLISSRRAKAVTFEFQGRPMYVDERRYMMALDNMMKTFAAPSGIGA
jgi:hypothetical protein